LIIHFARQSVSGFRSDSSINIAILAFLAFSVLKTMQSIRFLTQTHGAWFYVLAAYSGG
jgi:hypothetical protein